MSLSSAIIFGTLENVTQMVNMGAQLNVVDEYGYTPLIETAIMDNIEMAKLLIDRGADINQHDIVGGTALHWAVDNHNLSLCHLLLEHGADPNAYNQAGESVSVKPLLRRQQDLRKLLYQFGADLNFAGDYINTKLLGHRFELKGYVDIVDHQGNFVEIDLEGFFLEFTLAIVLHSLEDFKNNFFAKHWIDRFAAIDELIEVFKIATRLVQYEHYRIDIETHRHTIDELIGHEPLLIPVSYEGHAITLIRYGRLLAKCDRSDNPDFPDNVVIYRLHQPQALRKDLICDLMYQRQSKQFIDNELPQLLGLEKITDFPITPQIAGNCSWANVEASIPVILFMAFLISSNDVSQREYYKQLALAMYYEWREWDKDRALDFCIHGFEESSPARKASKAALLGAILFQRCSAEIAEDRTRASKIIPILQTPGYEYVLESYIEVYCHQTSTAAGKNLQKLLRLYEQLY